MPKSLKNYKNKEKCRNYRNKQRMENYKTGRLHQTEFGKWTDDEIDFMLSFKNSDRLLSIILKRSVSGIQTKRSRVASQKYKENRKVKQ